MAALSTSGQPAVVTVPIRRGNGLCGTGSTVGPGRAASAVWLTTDSAALISPASTPLSTERVGSAYPSRGHPVGGQPPEATRRTQHPQLFDVTGGMPALCSLVTHGCLAHRAVRFALGNGMTTHGATVDAAAELKSFKSPQKGSWGQ